MEFEINKHDTKNWWSLIITCDCGKTKIISLDGMEIPIYRIENLFNCKYVKDVKINER